MTHKSRKKIQMVLFEAPNENITISEFIEALKQWFITLNWYIRKEEILISLPPQETRERITLNWKT